MTKTALKVSALVLAAALATGCANTGDLEETANRAAADAARGLAGAADVAVRMLPATPNGGILPGASPTP